jgi:hypothetical protein
MNTSNSKFGWTISLAGLLLLAALGKLSLLVVLVPAAAALGFGFLWLARKADRRVHGLK